MVRLLCLLALLAPATGQELLTNGGFEGDYPTLAPPWVANSYGDNTFRFLRATPGHAGPACQRAECSRFDGGGIQWYAPRLAVRQGQVYTISLWARGEIEGHLFVGFRRHAAPYTRYLVRHVRLTPAWRRYTIVGEAAGTDEDCGLYLNFQSAGWAEIDEVSAVPGAFPATAAAIEQAPVKGNRVHNGSFELAGDGWAPLTGLTVEPGPSPVGGGLVRLGGTVLEGRPLVTTAGQVYTISAWLRRPAGPTAASLALVEYMDAGGDHPVDRHRLAAPLQVTAAWTRYHVTGVWEPGFTVGAIPRLTASASGVECDGLQVEEGPLTDYRPQAPLELAADLPLLERYPEPGATVRLGVRAAAEHNLPARVPVTVRQVDLLGRVVDTTPVELTGQGRTATGTVTITAPAAGLRRVEIAAAEGPPADVVLGVLPRLDPGRDGSTSFFGTHAPVATDAASANLAATISARAGCGWQRLHDFTNYVQWHMVEPEPGQRVWYDEPVQRWRSFGFELLGTLARTPPWAAREKTASQYAGVPRDPAELERYVRDTVTHYRSVIQTWEAWNEPYGSGFFAGPPEEYAALLQTVSRACRAADPDCRVVGVCAYLGLTDWVERVLKVSGTACFDIFSYHRYFSPNDVREVGGQPPVAQREVRWVRELLQRYGGERPIWHTEGGVACPTFHAWLPPDGYRSTSPVAAATLAKAATLLRSVGVERWFYYYAGYAGGGRGDYYTLGNAPYILVDFDGSPKATLLALAAAERFIGTGRFVGQRADGPLRSFDFTGPRGAVTVCWSETGEAIRLQPVPGEVCHDVVGARLPAGPVVVEALPVYRVREKETGAQPANLTP